MKTKYVISMISMSDDDQNRARRYRHFKNPISVLGLILGFLMLVPVPGLTPIRDAQGFIICECGGGRQALPDTDTLEGCAAACDAQLPPPIVFRGCSGVSVDGLTTLQAKDRIVQCGSLFKGGLGDPDQIVLDALIPREKSAVDTVLSAHALPETDRGNVMGFARNSVRGFLYADLLSIIKKPDPRLTEEQAIVGAYAEKARLKRLDAAEFALSEFNRWEANVCANFGTGYTPPMGFTYPRQDTACTQIGQTFGGPQPPSSAELFAYGTAHAYDKISTDAQTAAIAVDTGRAIGFAGVLVAAGAVGLAVAIVVVFTSLGTIILAAVLPFAGLVISIGGILGTTALVTSAAAIGAAVSFVIVAIAIALLQGIAVFEAAAIPGELQARVDAAQVAPDLRASIGTKEGMQELYGVFIESTMPDFPNASAPPARVDSDRRFRIKDESGNPLGVFPSIDFQSHWLPGQNWEARLSGGWFVPKHISDDANIGTIETLRLDIAYLNWAGEKWNAWRRGDRFVHTKLGGNASEGFVSDEIKYKDWDGIKRIASILVDNTPPVITPNVTGTLGDNGWYTSNVHVTWSVQDPESAIQSKTGCDDRSITSDGITAFTCTATSEGGEKSSPLSIKRDTTVPGIQGSRTPGANGNGWNNADVTVSFACNVLEVVSCGPDQTLSSEGTNQSVTGTAKDQAGNTASATVSGISIDKTQPTAAASPAPAANGNGWNKTDVVVSFSGTDAGGSGIAACTDAITLGEGANQSAAGTCTDQAGNASASAAASDIDVDKTNPAVTVTGVTGGATYTFGAVPAAGCSTSDALSGVAANAVLSLSGGNSLGLGSFTASCGGASDKAGNTGAAAVTYTVVPTPFSGIQAKIEIERGPRAADDELALKMGFTLGAGSNGIAPLTEPVTVKIGTLSLDIPTGSFGRDRNGRFKFEGTLGGVPVEARITFPGRQSLRAQA